MILLPTAYLGNLQYYSKLLSGEACIDLHEHYLKQSYRNRCDILSAGGVMSLTVPVYHTGGVGTNLFRECGRVAGAVVAVVNGQGRKAGCSASCPENRLWGA